MALMDCPECGEKISTTATACVHCGYLLKKQKKRRKTKRLLIGLLCTVLILGGIFVVLLYNFRSPYYRAIRILEDDYGQKVNVYSVYYNEEYNGCYVEFASGGIEDSACVHFDSNTVGYESEFERLASRSDNDSLSEKQRQKYAQEVVAYLDYYDPTWAYVIFMKGTLNSDWELVY